MQAAGGCWRRWMLGSFGAFKAKVAELEGRVMGARALSARWGWSEGVFDEAIPEIGCPRKKSTVRIPSGLPDRWDRLHDRTGIELADLNELPDAQLQEVASMSTSCVCAPPPDGKPPSMPPLAP